MLVIPALLIEACGLRNPIVVTIAESTPLAPGWQTFAADPPLVPRRRTQRLSIAVDAVPDWDVDHTEGAFTAPDGTRLRLEAELVADDGRTHALDALGLGPGLTFSYTPRSEHDRLPADATYVAVKIHSDVSWQGGALEWIDLTNY